MALLAEVEQFITDTGLTAEQAAQMRVIFEAAPAAQEKVKGGVLRQSDYSKHQNSLKAAQDELAEKQTKLDQEFARLSQYGTEADGKVLKAQQAVEAAEARVVKAQNRAKRWVETYGVPEEEAKEVFGDLIATTETTPAAGGVPFTKADFDREVQGFADRIGNQLTLLPAVSQKIMVEHFNLFGKFPEDIVEVTQAAIKAKKPLADFASEHYKFSDRRSELNEKKIEDRITSETDKRVNARLSELKVPTSARPALPTSRLFGLQPTAAAAATTTTTATTTQTGAPARSSKVGSVQNRMSTVQKAVSAFREAKYASK